MPPLGAVSIVGSIAARHDPHKAGQLRRGGHWGAVGTDRAADLKATNPKTGLTRSSPLKLVFFTQCNR